MSHAMRLVKEWREAVGATACCRGYCADQLEAALAKDVAFVQMWQESSGKLDPTGKSTRAFADCGKYLASADEPKEG